MGAIWTFSLRGVLTFVASGSDINGRVQCWEDLNYMKLNYTA